MIPIRDINPRQTTPWVNYALLAANALVWIGQLLLSDPGMHWLAAGYGLVPSRISADPGGEAFTILTSMFMHGGWTHLAGNMLFLYVFGDNVEDAMGHGRYALFYLVCGFGAALGQVVVAPSSPIPMVGASGAIAGVLGAYLVLYPRAPVLVFFPIWFPLGFFPVFPAALVVGIWFFWNLLGGFGSLGDSELGGVAFFAHLAGFIVGLLLVRPAMRGRERRESERWKGWRPPPRPPGGGFGASGRTRGSGRSPWY